METRHLEIKLTLILIDNISNFRPMKIIKLKCSSVFLGVWAEFEGSRNVVHSQSDLAVCSIGIKTG